ncbi:hypothetical protein BCR36DRAFT_370642 [Piromyces finnis]|uniref:Uncharacterized protein n=1 Tax=Piromyces finnis TaxID=1754191 RepID=A0A1Y1V8D2_9FUNG|nr:hypothetical protein BCR36DRAFT_370642 [Piromyces finnis]|eukprot:ORX49620.1 hypothetical protein BCR36DRAFT_370642 [Piromyces finnis]
MHFSIKFENDVVLNIKNRKKAVEAKFRYLYNLAEIIACDRLGHEYVTKYNPNSNMYTSELFERYKDPNYSNNPVDSNNPEIKISMDKQFEMHMENLDIVKKLTEVELIDSDKHLNIICIFDKNSNLSNENKASNYANFKKYIKNGNDKAALLLYDDNNNRLNIDSNLFLNYREVGDNCMKKIKNTIEDNTLEMDFTISKFEYYFNTYLQNLENEKNEINNKLNDKNNKLKKKEKTNLKNKLKVLENEFEILSSKELNKIVIEDIKKEDYIEYYKRVVFKDGKISSEIDYRTIGKGNDLIESVNSLCKLIEDLDIDSLNDAHANELYNIYDKLHGMILFVNAEYYNGIISDNGGIIYKLHNSVAIVLGENEFVKTQILIIHKKNNDLEFLEDNNANDTIKDHNISSDRLFSVIALTFLLISLISYGLSYSIFEKVNSSI